MAQEDKSSTQQRGPGDVLRAARESAGMSVEQVADKLHLLQSVVSSLEKDCYDRIRGETFVRGYLRNYARLLGVDAEDVLSRHRLANPAGKSEARLVVVALAREDRPEPAGGGLPLPGAPGPHPVAAVGRVVARPISRHRVAVP
mgnify:CR=1 FL=1